MQIKTLSGFSQFNTRNHGSKMNIVSVLDYFYVLLISQIFGTENGYKIKTQIGKKNMLG